MKKNLGTIKILLWIVIILSIAWFFICTFYIPTLELTEGEIFLARQIAIFGLSWAVLFFFAMKDIKKNLAIINGAIIMGAMFIITWPVYKILMDIWFGWIPFALVFVLTVLLFMVKPKAAQ